MVMGKRRRLIGRALRVCLGSAVQPGLIKNNGMRLVICLSGMKGWFGCLTRSNLLIPKLHPVHATKK